MKTFEYSIDVRDLTKCYGQVQAIKDVSFTVSKGEVIGLLGPNGAGKSTTMRVLCGLLPASSGEAYICGTSVARYPEEIKQHVGYMLENNPLPEDLRVLEYLRLRARLKGVLPRRIKPRVDEVMDLCDLNRTARYKLIGRLSKGYQQRIGIADAILAEPDVVIMDEPTIGLDPYQIASTRELIETLRGKMSVMLSSHILTEIELSCDRVLIINQGHIVADGTPNELRAAFISTVTYKLSVKGPKNFLEAALAKVDSQLTVVACGEPDGEGFYEVRVEGPRGMDKGADLIRIFTEHPHFSLKAANLVEPNLEAVFMAVTKRSWDRVVDVTAPRQ